MKAGIVTITNGPSNFGNVLQTFAVQESLKKLGIESELIRNYSFVEYRKNRLYLVIKLFTRRAEGLKSIHFDHFIKKYIHESKEIITSKIIPSVLCSKYDFYICGSDQIWNPLFDLNRNFDVMFLKFVESKKIKVALSASFGVDHIPSKYEECFREGLKNIDFLSVREEAGREIVYELSEKRAVVLIDPTLSLDKEEWTLIAKKPKWIKKGKKFILSYFLGQITEEYKKAIHVWKDNLECEIIDLMDNQYNKIYSTSPEEFIWLIANSALVVTDSYHASIFSFIMEVPFVVFLRKDKNGNIMNSRINTLTNKFDLEDHIYVGQEASNQYFCCDYQEGKKRLNAEKKIYSSFLEEVLKTVVNKSV